MDVVGLMLQVVPVEVCQELVELMVPVAVRKMLVVMLVAQVVDVVNLLDH